MKTLIIGLGNPILGDDGVGWRVAEEVANLTAGRTEVRVECFALGGLSLMEQLTGCKRAILIDSIYTGTKPIGTVSLFPLADLPDSTSGHTTAVHDTSLRNALSIGRSMNITLPKDEDVKVVAIEAEAVYDFSEQLTRPVEAAVPLAVEAVLKLLE
ncbi:MAG: hydrogenase maturation protease [Chloroflexi bacterium]|nr:hydrogenase maturation protease [Chloroflexota bacterium]